MFFIITIDNIENKLVLLCNTKITYLFRQITNYLYLLVSLKEVL